MDVGFYGKLPTHGDFLRRRVADDFLAAWDPWLQRCIAESRAALGEQWLAIYLTSPVWRFALGAHICGTSPVAGLIVPSVDRVGRYFPLTLVWPTPVEWSALEVAVHFDYGFECAERLLLDTLAMEHFEFADFDRRVMQLADNFRDVKGGLRLRKQAATAVVQSKTHSWRIPLQSVSALHAPAVQLLGCQMEAGSDCGGLWWTDGSAVVSPSWLMTPGLPDPGRYCAMLDGDWTMAGWNVAETEADAPPVAERPRAAADTMLISSAALTDRGPVRSTNQDALIERQDMQLWAVADGMGGLSEGEVASRMVCDSLAECAVAADLDEQIELVGEQLRQVNAYLRHAAKRADNPVQSGSTVVVLLIRPGECAMLWAGDSRVYRLRDGLLSQMTRDHSWAAHGLGDESVITRAVGAEDRLELDVVRSDVRAADRYMLCSDGVGRVLDPDVMRQLLQTHSASECCAQLIAKSIAQGGTDNATALVVDCAAVDLQEGAGAVEA